MGYFWEGVPAPLLRWAVVSLGSEGAAVESGTYRGDSAAVLAQHFATVTTIERSDAFAQAALERFQGRSGVTVLHGSSADLIERALPDRDTPALFWLDAHYSGGQTAGADFVCPAMEELAVISAGRDAHNTIVLVDDARSFLPSDGWPSVGDLCRIMIESGMDVVLVDDVLVAATRTRLLELESYLPQARSAQVPSLFPVYRLTHMVASARNRSLLAAARVRRKTGSWRIGRP